MMTLSAQHSGRFAIALMTLFHVSQACVFLMGESKDSVAAHPAGVTHWNYGLRGNDWEGHDASNNSWVCKSGKNQSPINLINYSETPKSPDGLKTTWGYNALKSNGSNIQVYNNGHTIQVQWTGELKSNVKIVSTKHALDVLSADAGDKMSKKFKLTPLQFHFHTMSEHAVDGAYYPLEMHIVHVIPQSVLPGCPETGCLSVTGIMFKVSDEIDAHNPFLDAIWEVMPEREGVVANMKAGRTLSIESLMPGEKMRDYMQYHGSLTTPPCTEGLLWHVFRTPMSISAKQYDQYSRAVGFKECHKKGDEEEHEGHGRRLNEGGAHDHTHHVHSHNHAAHQRLAAFKRGAYSGFTPAHELHTIVPEANSRKLLAKEAAQKTSAGDEYTCSVMSFGTTNRDVQVTSQRKVLAFAR